MLSDLIRDFF